MNNIHESQKINLFFCKLCYQRPDDENITRYYNLDFLCFNISVKSYFSLVENTATASFFSYNHTDLR